MTGWQDNEGGWNPQQDPYGQQPGGEARFGGDPFSSDPYPGQYTPDPYAATYGSSAYPAYQTGWSSPPPEPPKRSKVPIILSVVAILAVVGTVVTVVLLNRNGDSAAGADTSTVATTTRSSPRPPSSRGPSGSQQPSPPGKEGWTTITMPGGTYQVPADWLTSSEKRDSGLGVVFDGGAVVGDYSCGGETFFRGFTATGEVPSKDGAPLDLNQTVTSFGKSFAAKFYRTPTVDAPAPTSTTVSGKTVAVLTAKLTNTPTDPACEATTGEVAILGVPSDKGGVRMLVVVNDLSGGPKTPPALPDPLAEDILSTVTFS